MVGRFDLSETNYRTYQIVMVIYPTDIHISGLHEYETDIAILKSNQPFNAPVYQFGTLAMDYLSKGKI